jgi:hypothetical protein
MSRLGVYAAAVLVILLTLIIPLSGAAVATVTVDAGVEYQSRAGGGIITFTNTYYPTAVTIADNYLTLTSVNTAFTTLGIDAPANANISITSIGKWNINYETDQTVGAKTERVYHPGRGVPTVSVGLLTTYSTTGDTTSVVTSLNDNVALTWPETPSYGTNQSANLIIMFLPLIVILAVVGARSRPEQWGMIVGTAIVAGVLLLLGSWLLGIGA